MPGRWGYKRSDADAQMRIDSPIIKGIRLIEQVHDEEILILDACWSLSIGEALHIDVIHQVLPRLSPHCLGCTAENSSSHLWPDQWFLHTG